MTKGWVVSQNSDTSLRMTKSERGHKPGETLRLRMTKVTGVAKSPTPSLRMSGITSDSWTPRFLLEQFTLHQLLSRERGITSPQRHAAIRLNTKTGAPI